MNLWSSHTNKRQAEPMTGRKRWGQGSVKTTTSDIGEIKVRENILEAVVGLPLSTSTQIEIVCSFL